MINPFIVKKYIAFLLLGGIPLACYNIINAFYGLWWALGAFFAGLIVTTLLANLLLDNPFRAMTEGKGIMLIDMNSTGIMTPFIAVVEQPYLFGKIFGRKIKDIFNRETVLHMTPPVALKEKAVMDKDGLRLQITAEDYAKARMAMYNFPVIIWNDQIKSILTKDFFAEREKDAFAEHGVLYLNRQMEDLTSVLRDFARHVIEQLKPVTSLFANKWIWIIIVVVLGIILAMFTPKIIAAFQGQASTAIQSFEPIRSSGQVVTPVG